MIRVVVVTNMICQLQESFALRCAADSPFEISLTKCGNFINIYKVKRTLCGRLGIRFLSSHLATFINHNDSDDNGNKVNDCNGIDSDVNDECK